MKYLMVLNALILISIIVFVGAFISVAYTIVQSAPTIRAGSPSQNITGNLMEVKIPVFLKNKGLLPLSDVFVGAAIEGPDGGEILVESNRITIPPGASDTFTIYVRVNMSKMTPEFLMSIMTEDHELPVNAVLKGSLQPFASLLVSASGRLHWGAPYSNIQLLEPIPTVYNSTHLFLQVPMSFTNNSTMFRVSGTGSIRILDENGAMVGYGEGYIEVGMGERYNGTIDLYFQVPWVGRLDLLAENVVKSYSVTIRFPAPLVGEVERTQTITMEWGTLIKDPQLGEFSVAVHNSTHSRISIPLRFEDASIFPFNGIISGIIYDATWSQVGQIEDLWLEVQPHQIYFGEMAGYVSNAAALQQKLNIRIILNMPYGTLERMVQINAKGT